MGATPAMMGRALGLMYIGGPTGALEPAIAFAATLASLGIWFDGEGDSDRTHGRRAHQVHAGHPALAADLGR